MEDKEYVVVGTFERMSPEEMYKRNLDRVSRMDYVRMAVRGLGRNEAVLVPRKAINETAVRVSVTRLNKEYKEIYKQEGFSERIRKYSVHRQGEGVVIVRDV